MHLSSLELAYLKNENEVVRCQKVFDYTYLRKKNKSRFIG